MKKIHKFLIVLGLIIILTILLLGLPAGVGSVKMISPEANIKAKELKEKNRLNEIERVKVIPERK